jgi:hypothetical protein
LLGFDILDELAADEAAAAATMRAADGTSALLVVPWGVPLDPMWRRAVVEGTRRGTAWCVIFNGTHLRLVHAGRLHSRRYSEFDLDLAVDDEPAALALRTMFAADRLTSPPGQPSAVDVLVAGSDREGTAVCRTLGQGVLDASTHIVQALMNRRNVPDVHDAFEQALTIVYRMLFLFFAEARALVPLWHPVYRRSYSMEALRERALERSPFAFWETVRALTRLAHAGCRAGDLRITAFNGRLFAPARTPLVDRRDLDDEAARRSVVALATRAAPDGGAREPISYRDLGVEQLGAVYETLLDYAPHVEVPSAPGPRQLPVAVSLRSGSGRRKATGTFYTPGAIVDSVVRRTLGPLVEQRAPDDILRLRVLDPSMGSGAFLVSACAFLAEAYERALADHGRHVPGELGPAERSAIKRTIAERCLYGVDLNPTAVQLARLSLWLATLAADRPLSFFDHHLQVGDSLVGAWVSDLARAPRGRRPTTEPGPLVALLDMGDAMRHVVPVRFSLSVDPNDTPAQVRAKERELAQLTSPDTPLARWKRVANVWCARWFRPDLADLGGAFASLADTILNGRGALSASATQPMLERAEATAAERRFFHWELEFPEVFFDADGRRASAAGFDAVVGNPPWDMVRADPRLDAGRGGQGSSDAFGVRFTRESGAYTAQSDGHANRYQMFVERAIALTRPGGRLGLVVPAGLISDQGSARLRRLLFSRCAVDGIVGFENRRAIFPIHRGVRFLLLSATAGLPTTSFGCRLGEIDPAVLDGADETERSWYRVHVSPSMLRTISGDGLAVPDLRSPVDVTIAERAAALFAPLGHADGWQACFGRELNATTDNDAFRPAGRGLPVVEGRHVAPFRVETSRAEASISVREAERRLGQRFHHARLGYRDVASPSNRLTLIAAVLPAMCVSTHTVFCLRTRLSSTAMWFLCGMFNSLLVNYLVRQRVTSHVTTAIVERLPIPTAIQAGTAYREIAAIARLVARRTDADAFARLNARVARLYQLTSGEWAHVVASFPLVDEGDRALACAAFERRH